MKPSYSILKTGGFPRSELGRLSAGAPVLAEHLAYLYEGILERLSAAGESFFLDQRWDPDTSKFDAGISPAVRQLPLVSARSLARRLRNHPWVDPEYEFFSSEVSGGSSAYTFGQAVQELRTLYPDAFVSVVSEPPELERLPVVAAGDLVSLMRYVDLFKALVVEIPARNSGSGSVAASTSGVESWNASVKIAKFEGQTAGDGGKLPYMYSDGATPNPYDNPDTSGIYISIGRSAGVVRVASSDPSDSWTADQDSPYYPLYGSSPEYCEKLVPYLDVWCAAPGEGLGFSGAFSKAVAFTGGSPALVRIEASYSEADEDAVEKHEWLYLPDGTLSPSGLQSAADALLGEACSFSKVDLSAESALKNRSVHAIVTFAVGVAKGDGWVFNPSAGIPDWTS